MGFEEFYKYFIKNKQILEITPNTKPKKRTQKKEDGPVIEISNSKVFIEYGKFEVLF